ncbi:hypothetical protein LDENG_00118060 [Lucifuga dentata]|nr:hypothetical protein LDENG_00118060 [Lucifuga dentata]
MFHQEFWFLMKRLAAPLTALTSISVLFRWSSTTDLVFTHLNHSFTSVPVLVFLDAAWQFVVEVDASETGFGAVLSQRLPEDSKLHLCAFFSHRLYPAERHYEIGNQELLAVKLALEEWRHWLERAKLPFLVWTNHKNLEPGSKNGKADALSCQWSSSEELSPPSTIIPSQCFVAAAILDVECEVLKVQHRELGPGSEPPGRLFVP